MATSKLQLSARASCAKPVDESSVPAHLVCRSCLGLLINCYQTCKGFRLCQKCFESKLHPTNSVVCPGSTDSDDDSDRLASQQTCTADLATRRELLRLSVLCTNVEAGCEERFPWKNLDQHLEDACEHEIVRCSRCSKDVVLFKLRRCHSNLQSEDCCQFHVSVSCPICGDSSRSLDRATFVQHMDVCPAKETDCEYSCVGCKVVLPRSQLRQHYACCIDEHLRQTVTWIQSEHKQKDQKIEAILARLGEIRVDIERLEQTAKQLQNEVKQKDQKIETLQQLVSKHETRLDALEACKIRTFDCIDDNPRQPSKDAIDEMKAKMQQMESSLRDLQSVVNRLEGDSKQIPSEPQRMPFVRRARHESMTDDQLSGRLDRHRDLRAMRLKDRVSNRVASSSIHEVETPALNPGEVVHVQVDDPAGQHRVPVEEAAKNERLESDRVVPINSDFQFEQRRRSVSSSCSLEMWNIAQTLLAEQDESNQQAADDV